MSSVSQGLNLEKGSFTPVANRLIQYDYIEKVCSKEDKRVSYLILTEKGQEFVDRLYEGIKKHIQKKLEILGEDEREVYFAAIRLVLSISKKIENNN